MAKKKKATKKTQTVSVSNVVIKYYPNTSKKTIYAEWKVTGSATSFTVAWQIMPWNSKRWFAASTTTASTAPKKAPLDCPTFDIPQNCQKVKALVKVSGVASGEYTVEKKKKVKKKRNGKVVKKKGKTVYTTKKYKEKIPKWKASNKWVESTPLSGTNIIKATTPGTPTVEIENGTSGRIKLENYNDTSGAGAKIINFELVRRSEGSNYTDKFSNIKIAYGVASTTFTAIRGYSYKARAATADPGKKGFAGSDFSAYSSEVSAGLEKAGKPTLATEKKAGTTVVKVSWTKVKGAKKYRIEYAQNKDYFDHDTGGQVSSVEVNAPSVVAYITNEIEIGHRWYFRVRAEADGDVTGGWSDVSDIILGTPPAAPTTWSLEDVAKVGGKVTLCWTHNSTDGSIMEKARVAWKIGSNGTYSTREVTIQAQDTEEDKVITTYAWESFPTGGIPDSSTVYWKVQTKGIANDYGPYSTERSIKFYSPPTLTMAINNNSVAASSLTGLTSDNNYVLITRFPITIRTNSGPVTQTPIGINYEVIAEEDYSVSIDDGTERYYAAGEVVFRHYTNIGGSGTAMHSQTLTLQPGNIFLQNNIHYTVRATIAMSNGLTAVAERGIFPYWENSQYDMTADIVIDEINLVAYVTPECRDSETGEVLTSGVLVSIYRREVNGSFVLVSKDNDVADRVTVMDIHPALDYARYRLVGISKITGVVSFEDLPGEPVDEDGIVIQWDEAWREIDEGVARFKETLDTIEDENYPAGSLLRLDYNVDVSDDMGKETSLVNYAGRTYPVSYYGTQRSLTSKWSVEIPKTDMEVLNSVRRLAMFGGDSYVREPNGTGYWAALTVSYSITHNSSVIPVNFNITRVEGDDLGVYAKSTIPEVTVVVEPEETPEPVEEG